MSIFSFRSAFFFKGSFLKRWLRKGACSSRGFTLTELIMTIVIMAVIGVSSSAQLSNVSNTKADLMTKKITSDIRYAQMLAIQTQKRTRVAFDTASFARTMSLLIESSPGTWTAIQNPLTKSNYVITFGTGEYSGVNLTSVVLNGGTDLVFDSLGRPFDLSGNVLNDPALIQFNTNFNLQVRSQTGKVTPYVVSE